MVSFKPWIKLKPPMVVTKEDCDGIIQAMDSMLTNLRSKYIPLPLSFPSLYNILCTFMHCQVVTI